MTETTDVAIVGCGPAGGLLAGRLARDGHKVIALEKRPQVGVPVRCGEAAGSRDEIANYMPIDEGWIVGEINAARMYAPDGHYVEKKLPGVGLMVNRDGFDQALARQAEAWGAEVRTHHEAEGLLFEDGAVTGLKIKSHRTQRSYRIQAKVTIGADGIEGFVGRWANLTSHLRPRQVHSAIEFLLEGDGFPTDVIELYLTKEFAPGGYAWVFPKGPRRANVGLGVHPSMAKNGTARDYCMRFIEAYYPDAKIGKAVAGGVSGTKPLKTMVADGILLVGEAGRQNNPFSGGGIMNALEGAEEAHPILDDALKKNDLSKESLQRYNKAWHARNGHLIQKYALLRELFFTLDDGDLNKVVSVLDKAVKARPGKIVDWTELFYATFKATPGLLWKVTKMLW